MITTLILWSPAYMATTILESGRREFLISNDAMMSARKYHH